MAEKRIRIPIALLMAGFMLLASLLPSSVCCVEEYVYYGIVDWETSSALIAIAAYSDGTNVKVHTLPDGELMSEAQLTMMETQFVTLPNGTFFKVVSDHLVSVMIFSEGDPPSSDTNEGPAPTGFQTSTDGGHVGKEYVFVTCQGLLGASYTILALEPSHVTITSEDDAEQSFRLEANEFKDLSLSAYKAYRVSSTGHIMIQSGGLGTYRGGYRTFLVPSAEGGFVGKRFHSRSARSWNDQEDCGFVISALEDTRVTMWDGEFKRVIEELEISEGGISLRPESNEIVLESDKPVTLAFIHNKSKVREEGGRDRVLLGGTTFMGIKPDEETPFLLPLEYSAKAYVFAYEDAFVEIDSVPMNIAADTYFLITSPGHHKIRSSGNLVVQVIYWSFTTGTIQSAFGAAIPCIQTVDVTPDVTLAPIAEESSLMPYVYVGFGVTAVVVAAAAGFIVVKRRSK